MILNRKIIRLNDQQNKMIKNGWGSEVLENTVVETITYLSDGLKVNGYIAYPKDESKKYPCVIWNRGGSMDEGAIDTFTARGIYGQLASWGYVVFASQYRGNAGSEGQEQLGGDDVNDILNLIPLAEEIPQADTNIWGIEGWSRGGMMTYITLSKVPGFKCAILSGAISDVKLFLSINEDKIDTFKKLIGETDFERACNKRSAVNFTDKLPNIPYLLMHGGNDKAVQHTQSIEIAKGLDERSIPYRLVIFEGGDHFLKSHRKEVDRLRRFWLDKYLK
jgi:dipeptidyl aminopeptidase/acylaminoacyl peptidase